MTEVFFGIGILKDGRESSVDPNAISYPECPYYDKTNCSAVDGECTHPNREPVLCYCGLIHAFLGINGCPFDIHEELHGGTV